MGDSELASRNGLSFAKELVRNESEVEKDARSAGASHAGLVGEEEAK